MSSSEPTAPTSKLQDTKANEPDAAAASKPVKQAPALLEEDDEFEDFPVEGAHPSFLVALSLPHACYWKRYR